MSRALALAAAAGLIVVLGLAVVMRSAAGADLQTAVVERGPFVDFLPLRGEIRPERSTILSAPSAGGSDMQIVQLVANGAAVRAGDPVVVFDSTNQQRTLEQKRSELRQAESELEKARQEERRRVQAAAAALEQAKSSAARLRLELDAADLLSRAEAEKRAIAVADADRLVKELEETLAGERVIGAAEIAIAQQKVDKTRFDLADTQRIIASLTLRAPRDGMVSLLPNFRAGGPMSRTSPEFRRGDRAWAGAAIAELPDLSRVRMTLRVDEADRARLATGAAVRIRVDAVPDRELAGRVAEISPVATPDFTSFPPVRNFDVTVAIGDSDSRLRSGMSAGARIELDRVEDALLVPATAVLERGGTAQVFVISDGRVERRAVTVQRRGRERVAVGSGLAEGERVAVQARDVEGETQ